MCSHNVISGQMRRSGLGGRLFLIVHRKSIKFQHSCTRATFATKMVRDRARTSYNFETAKFLTPKLQLSPATCSSAARAARAADGMKRNLLCRHFSAPRPMLPAAALGQAANSSQHERLVSTTSTTWLRLLRKLEQAAL